MAFSMTGFGRYETEEAGRRFTVELRGVNNRFLDLNIRMPKRFARFEADIRSELKNYARRGKVDVSIGFEKEFKVSKGLRYNEALAAGYSEVFLKIMQGFADCERGMNDQAAAVAATAVIGLPDVVIPDDDSFGDEAEIWEGLRRAIDGAGEAFMAARRKEGDFLAADMLEKLDEMQECTEFIAGHAPEIIEEYKAKLKGKIKDLIENGQIDEGRLAAEVTIYADKICVDEELVRLDSHIRAMRDILRGEGDDEGIGRKLDFLAQEMNRETNTLLSKSTDQEISDRGIILKTDIEKLREQIQNLE